MKKRFLLTISLAMFLGVGVAVGARQSQRVEEVKADGSVPSYVYFEWSTTPWSSWGVEISGSRAYFFDNEDAQKSAAFPGNAADSTETKEGKNYTKFAVPTGSTKVIFTFVKDGWNRTNNHQTVDLVIPTDGKDACRLTTQEGGTSDSCKYNVEWFKYSAASYTVTLNLVDEGGEVVSSSTPKVGEGQNAPAPELKYGEQFSGWYKESTLTTPADPVTAETTLYGRISNKETASFKVDTGNVSSDFASVYLHAWDEHGDKATWPGEEATKVGDFYPVTVTTGASAGFLIDDGNMENEGANIHKTVDVSLEGAKEYLIIKPEKVDGKYTVQWSDTPVTTPKEDPSETKNIFYVWQKDVVLSTELANIKAYGFGQEETIKGMDWPGVAVEAYEVEGVNNLYKVQLSESYPKFIINDGSKQTADIELVGAEDEQPFSHVGEVFYLYDNEGHSNFNGAWFSLDDLTVANGTYLRGDWVDGWSVSGQKQMILNPGNENEVMISDLSLGAGATVKVVTYTDHIPTWRNPSTVTSQDENFPASKDEYANAKVEKAADYNLYVNFNNWSYSFLPTANANLEAAEEFAAAFNTAIAAKCDANGVNTDLDLLKEAWDAQAVEFGKLNEDVQEILKKASKTHTVKAIGEFAKKYDYVFGKYSATLVNDFAKRNPTPISGLGLNTTNSSNSSITIILIAAATVTSIAVGLYFINRRKER